MQKDAARPGVIRRGIDSGGAATEGSGQSYVFSQQASAWEKDAARPRMNNVRGRTARREAASLLATADRRMSKMRPGCVSAMPQSMRNRSKRQTHSDRLVEDGAQGPLRSRRPTGEAINSNRQTGVQRRKRSTSNHRTGVQRAKGLSLQPPDWTEDEGLGQLVVSARAACEGPASTPLRQHSLVGDRGRANHPPVMPVQQGSRTQVSMVGNLGESQTAQSLSPGPAPR